MRKPTLENPVMAGSNRPMNQWLEFIKSAGKPISQSSTQQEYIALYLLFAAKGISELSDPLALPKAGSDLDQA